MRASGPHGCCRILSLSNHETYTQLIRDGPNIHAKTIDETQNRVEQAKEPAARC